MDEIIANLESIADSIKREYNNLPGPGNSVERFKLMNAMLSIKDVQFNLFNLQRKMHENG